jgi:hypothetical protein
MGVGGVGGVGGSGVEMVVVVGEWGEVAVLVIIGSGDGGGGIMSWQCLLTLTACVTCKVM